MANIDWDRLTQRACYLGVAPLLYDNNLVADMRSLVVRRAFEVPVVIDAIHSVQLRGGTGTGSSDQREFVPHLARAAVATGCDALFMESTPTPTMLPPMARACCA